MQSNFSKLTCYIICGVDITLPEYRRLQRFENLHSVDLSSVLLLESGFQLLLAGVRPSTVSLQEVASVQKTDFATIDAALELPWGRTGGVKRARADSLDGAANRRVAHRAAHHGGSLAESPVHHYATQFDNLDRQDSPAALPSVPLPASLPLIAAAPTPPPTPPAAAVSRKEDPSTAAAAVSVPHMYVPRSPQRKPMTAAQHAAAVAKHRPCAQDLAAGLRVVSVLEALLAQRAALTGHVDVGVC